MAEMQVLGPPGTGKTTYLATQVQRAAEAYGSTRVVVCSLTRAAAAEIAGRGLPVPREHVGTLHALAYRELGRPKIADTLVAEFNAAHPAYAVTPEVSAPDKDDAVDAPAADRPGDAARAEVNLLRARMVDPALWPAMATSWYRAWRGFKDDTGTMDFTDLIETALRDVPTAPGGPEAILADEVQDYSRLEAALLRRWGERAASLVLAGDADQAIYEWRGADPGVFVDHYPGEDRRRVLAQSYRVPRAVYARAVAWVRRIKHRVDPEYRPRDADGEVTVDAVLRWKYPEAALQRIERWVAAGESVMIAATCDYMLAPTLAVLRREGIPFANPWRRQNGAWNPLTTRRNAVSMAERLLAFLRPDVAVWGEDRAQQWSAEDLRRWTAVLRAEGILRRGAKAAIDRLGTDSHTEVGLDVLHEWLEDDAFDRALELDVDWWVRSMLVSKQNAAQFPVTVLRRRGAAALTEQPLVYVGTVHSFKGAEADHVILFPDLSPAGARQWNGGQVDAVRRVFYVGMTRARSTLALASPSSPYAVAW